jgi:hypothetical protein
MVLFMRRSHIFFSRLFVKKSPIFLLLPEAIVCIISPLAKIMNDFIPEMFTKH